MWIIFLSSALVYHVTDSSFVGLPLFNAMTPYFWTKNPNEEIMYNKNVYTAYQNESCEILGLNYLFRHAARYPSLVWIERMEKVHSLLAKDPTVVAKNPFVSSWVCPFPKSKEYQQSEVGNAEMELIGKRFYRSYKKIADVYKDSLSIFTTSKQRTEDSYASFIKGWIAENVTFHGFSFGSNDEIMRYYDHCKKYTTQVKNNPQSHAEVNKFLNGGEMTQVKEKVGQKLGFSKISADDVITIQQICAFELGMFNSSDWCALFDIDDLEVIDYLIDMRNYYELGYGYDINWKMACRYTELRLFGLLDNLIETEYNGPASRFQYTMNIDFGHTNTILPLYTAFGLFNDSQPFLASNYNANKNRKFRTSSIGPFSANLGFGLYSCKMQKKHIVKLFVNEEAMKIPKCGDDSDSCLYQDFVQIYKSLGTDCDFEKLCSVQTSSGVLLGSSIVHLLVAAILIASYTFEWR